MQEAREVFDALNVAYLGVHKPKEELFWATYMATSNDDAGFSKAEEAYKNFISDPARLASVRSALDMPPARCAMASKAGWHCSKATLSTAMRRAS